LLTATCSALEIRPHIKQFMCFSRISTPPLGYTGIINLLVHILGESS